MKSSLQSKVKIPLATAKPVGLFLLAALLLTQVMLPPRARAQDTGPIAPNSLNYQNAKVNTILDLYEQLSGKHLIRDANLDGVPPVSVNATGMSKPDTMRIIETTLLLNGVAIIPVDAQTLKVVTVGTNKNPRSEGVKLYANALDLPTDDAVVTYYMPLNYVSPQEVAGVFTQVAPVHTYGAYVPEPSAQAVVITENVSTIRQLIALKELIDVPPARVASEWIQLNRADSDKTADLLNKLLGNGPAGAPGANNAGPGGPVSVPAGLGNTAPLSNEKDLISGPAQIISDPRSNRLLIITRPVNMPFLEQMVTQLDQPDIFMVPQRRDLKYVLAADVLPALEAALAQGKDELDQVKKDETSAQTKPPGQQGGAGGQQAQSGGGGGGASGSVSAITPQLSTPTENNVPTVVTLGNTRLLADNRSNSIIIFGSPDIVARAFNMIDQLDRRPLQVNLATVIGQLTVKEGEEFGIDILQKFQKVGQGGLATSNLNTTSGTSAIANSPEPHSLTSSLGFPLLSGLNLYGAIGSTLDAYVRALETTNRFKVIERPSIFTENNKLAVIASGSQVPVPSSTTSGFAGTSSNLTTTSSIAYEDVLLQLDIIPLINADHDVTLQIRQTNNSLGGNETISGNTVPIIDTQEINTAVTVPDKSTVVIGGLINDTTNRDTSGIPWLSDIPVLGYLFKDVSKSKERDELIIMIQPTVIETDADLVAVNEQEKQRTILGREAVQAATGMDEPPPTLKTTFLNPQGAFEMPPAGTTTTVQSTTYNSKTHPGTHTTTTTTTTTIVPPTSTSVITPLGPTTPTGPVPAVSSPAPDVSNGQMPRITPPSPPTTAP